MDKTTKQVIAIVKSQIENKWSVYYHPDNESYKDTLITQICAYKHIINLFEDDEYRSKMYEIYKDRIEKEENTCDM